MRNRKSFLSCAVVIAGLLAAPGVMAADPPTACGVPGNPWLYGPGSYWKVEMTGPTYAGGKTSVTYTVTQLGYQKPDHLGVLAAADPSLAVSLAPGCAGSNIAAACYGDNLTGLGKLSCHEQAIRVNPAPSVTTFTVSAAGRRTLVPSSFVVRNNKHTSACVIAGLGGGEQTETADACVSSCGNFHPKQTILKEEVFRFLTGTGKSCFARFRRDLSTGEVIDAGLTSTSDAVSPSDIDCDFEEYPVSELQLVLGGSIVIGGSSGVGGEGQFGDGFLSTGSESCTTRIIGGRVYTWGDPCPE